MKDHLMGKNQIDKFRRVADELTTAIASCENVVGIVLIGGLVRGFADRFSDVDIIALIGRDGRDLRRKIHDLGIDAEKRWRIDVDLEVHFITDFEAWKWEEADREFSKARIVFDPYGRVKKTFREKVRRSEDFWVKRTVIAAEYLKWYCCPPKKGVGTIAEAWVERGDLLSAHYCVNYGIDLFVRMLFALNKEFVPAPKWRVFYSYTLRWVPTNYKSLLREALQTKDFSLKELRRRLKALNRLWRESIPRIENETGLTLEKISQYYVQEVLHHSEMPRQ